MNYRQLRGRGRFTTSGPPQPEIVSGLSRKKESLIKFDMRRCNDDELGRAQANRKGIQAVLF